MKTFRLRKDYVAVSNVSVRHFYCETSKHLSQPKDYFHLINSSDVSFNSGSEKAKVFNEAFVQNFANISNYSPMPTLCKALRQTLPVT